MGTHPIFESDFDCLTDMAEIEEQEEVSLLPMVQSLSSKDANDNRERTTIGQNRSAFTIGGSKRLHPNELVGRSNIAGKIDASLKKQTNKILRKKNLFETPLEKKDAKKASRKMYYDQTITKVNKWDDTVKKFRVNPSIDLRDVNQAVQMVPTEAKTRKLGTELERELDSILHGSKYIPDEGEELSRAEKAILNTVSVEEAKLRRIELQKHRHLQSQYQAKARRMRKIKSKTFHRHLKKREKKEQEGKEEEEEDIDEKLLKDRAEDRATLKHS